jgi:uncharacterized Zn finger protein (UPF0148 family)
VNGSNWQIEQQCPQCGAPIILDEADRILLCKFCRTRVYLSTKDHFRYYIPPAKDIGESICFIPYWRLKGLSYTLEGLNTSYRFFDATLLAFSSRLLPVSLGLRPQALKLKFVGRDNAGEFIEPSHKAREALSDVNQSIVGKPDQQRIFIGETISVIYAPVYSDNGCFYDAILKKPFTPKVEEKEIKQALLSAPAEKWQVNFIPMLCPNCGADLPGEKDALIVFCPNCDSAWKSSNMNFIKVDFSIWSEKREDIVYIPFWRMKAKIDGVQLETYADLIEVANLPKVTTEAWKHTPFYFWAPAFKINPAVFLRWCRQLTITPAETDLKTEAFPAKTIYPVTLPATEAAKSLIITLANLVTDKRRLPDLLASLKYTVEDALLVLHPFAISPKELIHTKLGFSMDRTALNFGTQL